MKIFFTTVLLAFGAFAYGQVTINLTQDLVLTETLVINQPTTYNGNGFKLICEGCDPAIRVTNGAEVHFQDVIFAKNFVRWLQVDNPYTGQVTWNSNRMKGFIRGERGGN